MVNNIFRDSLRRKVEYAISSAADARRIDHNGIVGRVREIFVRDILQPAVPRYVEFGNGKITDHTGKVSSEIDVIIYSSDTLSPLVFEYGFGIYPAESCLYAIEVKSRITSEEIKDSIRKFRKLMDISYLPYAIDKKFRPTGPNVPRVVPALFGFGSDLSDARKSELERYRELDSKATDFPTIPVFCIVGKGYWHYRSDEPEKKWIDLPPTEEYQEVIDFIAGISNTIPDMFVLKGRPRLGNYLSYPRDFEKK